MGPEHSSSKPLCLGSMLVFVVVHATRTCLDAFSVRVFTSSEFVPAPNHPTGCKFETVQSPNHPNSACTIKARFF